MKGFVVPARIVASRPFRRIAPKIVPRAHRATLRLTRGRTMFATASQPMIMLITTGAKSGRQRETPVAMVPRAHGRMIVVGSNFARDSHPAWTANLAAHPRAEVVAGGRRFAVDARRMSDDERLEIWPQLLEWFPGWTLYTDLTDRTFRVFELVPVDGAQTLPNADAAS